VDINNTGYGLTGGIHSRIGDKLDRLSKSLAVGNLYTNRNIVGAVVGVQPFGGHGLSGTGAKAGGPLYMTRLYKYNVVLDILGDNDSARLDLDNIVAKLQKNSILSLASISVITTVVEQLNQYGFINKIIKLEGPTGESNTLSFRARGNILLLANSLESLVIQALYAKAFGNQLVLLASNQYIPAMRDIFGDILVIADMASTKYHVIMLSYEYDLSSDAATTVANLPGEIRLIDYEYNGSYEVASLVSELSVSDNLTATGGNVELMSIIDRV